MNQPLETLITFILYLGLFAWIGRSRGTLRELIILGSAVIGWVLLNEQGGIFARLANIIGKFLATVRAVVASIFLPSEVQSDGGILNSLRGASQTFSDAGDLIVPEYQDSFSFILWVGLVLLAYFISNRFPNTIGNGGWAMLLGIANGLFFTSIFLPRLVTILTPGEFNVSNLGDLINTTGIFSIFGGILSALWVGLQSIWSIIGGQEFYIFFLILITALIAWSAKTLEKGE